jgi:LemA protein
MTTTQIVWAVVAAALLFWIVGAYNRLVRLRGEIVRRFPPVDEQFTLRGSLLQQQIDALAPVLPGAAPRIEVLRRCLRATREGLRARAQAPGASARSQACGWPTTSSAKRARSCRCKAPPDST